MATLIPNFEYAYTIKYIQSNSIPEIGLLELTD
jgi:hypothetical protein